MCRTLQESIKALLQSSFEHLNILVHGSSQDTFIRLAADGLFSLHHNISYSSTDALQNTSSQTHSVCFPGSIPNFPRRALSKQEPLRLSAASLHRAHSQEKSE